jgi:hypothetical protein
MNRFTLFTVGIALVVFCWWNRPGVGYPDDQPKEHPRLGAPGTEHKHLQPLVGSWLLSIAGTNKRGTAEFQSIWDGRFVTEEATLPFGDFQMKWKGIYGYDRHKKKYTAVWVDNMDTNIESGEGDLDPAGKVLTIKGQHEDPRSGRMSGFLWRITIADAAKLKIEMVELDKAGRESWVFEILGERAR